MGVPKFFRWVTERYPSILSGIVNDTFDTPEIDNLYLDMNGIIHNCSHDNDEITIALSTGEIIAKVLREVDRLVTVMVKPKSVLFIAVDGVAPRAKLNQQRSRRFRSARDRLVSIEKEKVKGSALVDGDVFDSNCITPGTAFMSELSIGIRHFIDSKLKEVGTVWSRLSVFFSGSEVPGEGEHKIMSFVRANRARPDYSPNIRHCLNGSDADMIMLSLATHEPYFLVLRDVLESRTFNNKFSRTRASHHTSNSSSHITSETEVTETAPVDKKPKNMQFVRIHVLRKYLAAELLETLVTTHFDAERVIDDFVFLTFFVGNDFLPHLPALDIGDSAFDMIFDAYKTVLAAAAAEDSAINLTDVSAADSDLNDEATPSPTDGSLYLVDGDRIDLEKLELIFALIGVTELTLYTEKETMLEQKEERMATQRAERLQVEERRREEVERELTQSLLSAETSSTVANDSLSYQGTTSPLPSVASTSSLVSLSAESVKSVDPFSRMTSMPVAAETAPVEVNLVDRELDYKHRYYNTKFGFAIPDTTTSATDPALREVVRQYLRGLQWCLSYYSRGCVSWSWYYPYHYGPFLHDVVGLATLNDGQEVDTSEETLGVSPMPVGLQLSKPFTPFQQLLACLPATSCQLLPSAYHWLMNDAQSPLLGYYPITFATDLNGKRQEYESVVLLPFIDRDVLLQAEAQYIERAGGLSEAERQRNFFGVTYEYHRDSTSQVVVVSEHPVDIRPGECFASRLVPGTITVEGDDLGVGGGLPGYPPLRHMPVSASFASGGAGGGRGGGGRGKASKSKFRSNYYSNQGQSSAVASESNSVAASVNGAAASAAPMLELPAAVTIRLLLDEPANKFLADLCAQIETLSGGDFLSLLSDGSSRARFPFAVTVMSSVRTKPLEVSVVTSTEDNPFETEVLLAAFQKALAKTASIFTPITCDLLPNCRVDDITTVTSITTCVSLKFRNASHLDQLEEFVRDRLQGDVFDGKRVFYRNRIHSVSVGVYKGVNANAFQMWLNNELSKLTLPSFTCSLMELDFVKLEEKKEEVTADGVYQYVLNSGK